MVKIKVWGALPPNSATSFLKLRERIIANVVNLSSFDLDEDEVQCRFPLESGAPSNILVEVEAGFGPSKDVSVALQIAIDTAIRAFIPEARPRYYIDLRGEKGEGFFWRCD